MALPDEAKRMPTPPQRYRIAIGEVVPNSSGSGTHPQKLDYFAIKRTIRQGGKLIYVLDKPMQNAACTSAVRALVAMQEAHDYHFVRSAAGRGMKKDEIPEGNLEQFADDIAAAKDGKPTAIPVSVVGNVERGDDGTFTIPDSIIWRRMARYGKGRCACSCDEWGEDGVGAATLKSWELAKSKDGKSEFMRFLGEKQIPCDPTKCQYAGAAADGKPTCKPQIIANLMLPFAPATGASAKFKTTGWSNFYAMRDSLLFIAAQTGGWLHEIPLWLVYGTTQNRDGNWIPQVRFEYRGDADALRTATIPRLQRWHTQADQLKQLQSGIVSETIASEDDPDEQEAFTEEFHPAEAIPHVPAADPADAPPAPDDDVIDVPEEDITPAPAKPSVPPLFAETPADAETIMAVLEANGMDEEKRKGLVEYAWNDATGTGLRELPGPGTCDSPEQQAAVLEAMTVAANRWWRRNGSKQAQPPTLGMEGGE